MEIMHKRVAGLDVHKETVVCCVRIATGKKVSRECRTFETTTAGLEALLAWLTENRCAHVAMEATGVYWKPVWNILSDGKFELILANAAHIKNVPGRKTDVNDATWIADLVAFGLIKASFVPGEKLQELRSLMRTRKQLGREQTRHIQRMQKTLEEANIKLDSVISEIMGLSGRRMIEAMIAGVRDPRKLAQLADRRIKASPKELYDALHGRLTEHHRFLLRLHLGQYDALAASIGEIDAQVDAAIARLDEEAAAAGHGSFRDLIALVDTIPGIAGLAATGILSEIGTEERTFIVSGKRSLIAGSQPMGISSAGWAYAPARTKVRANANPQGFAKAPPGSRPCSSNAPGPPSKRKTATTRRSSTVSRPGAAPRKRYAPLRPRCSPRFITCSRMASNIGISGPVISIAARLNKRPGIWSLNLPSLALKLNFNLSS